MNLLQLMYLTKQATFEQEMMEKEAKLGGLIRGVSNAAKKTGTSAAKQTGTSAATPNASTFPGRLKNFAQGEWNRLTPAQQSMGRGAAVGTGAGTMFGAGYQAGKDGNLERVKTGIKATGARPNTMFGR